MWKLGVLLRVLEASSLEEWKRITLSVTSSGSAKILRELREDHAEADKNLLHR